MVDQDMFSSLSEDQIKTFQKFCTQEEYQAGQVVFYEGSVGNLAYIILKGQVEIWKDYDSPEQDLLAVFGAGQMFGEIAVLDDQPRSATVVARDSVLLISIDRENFYQVVTENTSISLTVMKSISSMVRNRTDNFAEDLKYRNRQLEKSHRQLQLEVEERKQAESALIESQKKLRVLSSHLLYAQESERKRLSKELHDDLGQSLALLKHMVRSVKKNSVVEKSFHLGSYENCMAYIDQIIENVRRISRNLSPTILDDLGFSAAFRYLVENFSRQYSIETSVEMVVIDHLFSMESKTNLYRIFQEIMTNIGKHARADHVSFSIEYQNNRVFFRVKDNGRGFNLAQARNKSYLEKGLGLNTIEERAKMMGALISIHSEIGKGTRITLDVPVESKTDKEPTALKPLL